MVNPFDCAWAAGFVEGEGCLLISRRGYVILEVEQVDAKPLSKLQRLWGGSLLKRNTRDCWRWRLSGGIRLRTFLSEIRGKMVGAKADQADLLIHFITHGGDIDVARRSLSALKGTECPKTPDPCSS